MDAGLLLFLLFILNVDSSHPPVVPSDQTFHVKESETLYIEVQTTLRKQLTTSTRIHLEVYKLEDDNSPQVVIQSTGSTTEKILRYGLHIYSEIGQKKVKSLFTIDHCREEDSATYQFSFTILDSPRVLQSMHAVNHVQVHPRELFDDPGDKTTTTGPSTEPIVETTSDITTMSSVGSKSTKSLGVFVIPLLIGLLENI